MKSYNNVMMYFNPLLYNFLILSIMDMLITYTQFFGRSIILNNVVLSGFSDGFQKFLTAKNLNQSLNLISNNLHRISAGDFDPYCPYRKLPVIL